MRGLTPKARAASAWVIRFAVRQPRNHAAPCSRQRTHSVSEATSMSSHQWTHQPHSPTSTSRKRSLSSRNGANTVYSARNAPISTMLSAPPRHVTTKERPSSARTALMFGASVTINLPINPQALLPEPVRQPLTASNLGHNLHYKLSDRDSA